MTMEKSSSREPRSAANLATVGDSRSCGTGSLPRRVQFLQQDNISTKSSTGRGIKLPVVIIPPELTFIANDPSSHKQTVTIYNPYDFHIKYRVFCTAPSKYQMPDCHGNISPCTYKDVTIRMTEIIEANVGVTDKFRIVVSEVASSVDQIQGEREVRCLLVASKESLTGTEIHQSIRQSMRHGLTRQPPEASKVLTPSTPDGGRRIDAGQGPSYFVLLVALVCIAALAVPNSKADCTEHGVDSWIAAYITLTLSQKLVAAYVLGLVTLTLFRSC
ncbi:motile sperm domain containing 1-like [Tropilaelaps mercedesae]|uniref:Motile sperm domain containing 1-like n=1 Tax=Tropilaelaps mercedesae TaxID=418985 RepID=A0A1V9XWN6_9ACAR|nr:motile sperm domain containing 1-like [Tropilaelaps mercedesae]